MDQKNKSCFFEKNNKIAKCSVIHVKEMNKALRKAILGMI